MTITPKLRVVAFCLLIPSMFFVSSCNQDDDDLVVPTTYSFSRDGVSTVNFSGQTERLDMLALMGTYMKTTNTVGAAAVEESVLNNMFGNVNDPFSGQTFTKDLKSKCFLPDTTLFQGLFNQLALASQSSAEAVDGTAGVIVTGSLDPTVGYRVNENGLELTQVILKGLMGSVFYYQAMEVYLSADRMGTVGNSDFETDKNYTPMEHYMDEAFGYFGIPVDFPDAVSLDEARFWGEYLKKRNDGPYPGMNDEMATAFRTARAAITAQDYQSRDEALNAIMENWSVVIAASAVDYLEQAKSTNGLAPYKRHHVLSEAIGFMIALKYHFAGGNSKYPPHYTYSGVETALETTIGLNTNLYTVTDTDIENTIAAIKGAFPAGEIQ